MALTKPEGVAVRSYLSVFSRVALAAVLAVVCTPSKSIGQIDARIGGGPLVPNVNPLGFPLPMTCAQKGQTIQRVMEDIAADPSASGEIRLAPGEYWFSASAPGDDQVACRTVRGNLASVKIARRAGASGEVVWRRAQTQLLFRFLRVAEGGTLEVEDITFVNGQAQSGGAIKALTAASLVALRCSFVCNAAADGGAVSSSESAAPPSGPAVDRGFLLQDCRFYCNTASRRGGAVDADRSPLVILGGVFSGNSVSSATIGDGGAVYFTKAAATSEFVIQIRPVSDTSDRPVFFNNTASRDGGALYVSGGRNIENEFAPGVPSLSESFRPIAADFANNRAGGSGGAAYLVSSNLRLDGCRFGLGADLLLLLQNSGRLPTSCDVPISGTCEGPVSPCGNLNLPTFDAALGGGNRAVQGGGVFNDRSRSYFKRCFFEKNQATSSLAFACNKVTNDGEFGGAGGGLYVRGSAATARVTATECCFIENEAQLSGAGGIGGGACCVESSSPVFDDCVFHRNRAARGGAIAIGCLSDVLLYNTVIVQNLGTIAAGGVFIQEVSEIASAPASRERYFLWTPKILHCTITDNLAALAGGAAPDAAGSGVHIATNSSTGTAGRGSAPAIANTIIWGNRRGSPEPAGISGSSFSYGFPAPAIPAAPGLAPDGTTGAPQVLFSIIDTGGAGNPGFPIPAGFPPPLGFDAATWLRSNFDANPRLANLADCNVHLTCPSPAIDRANYLLCRELLDNRARAAGSPLLFYRTNPAASTIVLDPTEIPPIIDDLEDDYDDRATDLLGNPLPPSDVIPNREFRVPDEDEPCPARNCPTLAYPGAEPFQVRTCRATQCQSDIGADESRTGILASPIPDKVVCLRTSANDPPTIQTFTVNGLCEQPSSQCDLRPGTSTPNTDPPKFTFEWCKVDPNDCNNVFVIPTNPADPNYNPNITISSTDTSSTITIRNARRGAPGTLLRDREDVIYRAKLFRGRAGEGIYVPLNGIAGQPCSCDMMTADGLRNCCPAAKADGRLYIVDPPTATGGGDRIVCRDGSQCLEYTFSWTEFPAVLPIACEMPPSVPPGTRPAPIACTPTISYTYQRALTGAGSTPVTFTGNARATIVCEPDTMVPDPVVPGAQRKTRVCRIRFVGAKDGVPNTAECDAGRYCGKISCGLATDKCRDAEWCNRLCVTPPPNAGGDAYQVVCVTGNQTINLFAEFPPPAACSAPWCVDPSCVPAIAIFKRYPPQVPPRPDEPLTIGQTGRVAVTCDPPTGVNRRINCRIVITGAQPDDCGQYCIVGECDNLKDNASCGGTLYDKCLEATWCANLCVLPPVNCGGDGPKKVCVGARQTINLFCEHPIGNCLTVGGLRFCDENSCIPATPVVKRITRNSNGTFTTITLGASRTDTVSGQGTSTTTVVCTPDASNPRRRNCVVTVTNANDANCAEYKIESGCSNLTAADKCAGMYSTSLCVAQPPSILVDTNKYVCYQGTQTIRLRACFPNANCWYCLTAPNGGLPPGSPPICIPRVMAFFRPNAGGADIPLLTAGATGGSGTVGHASVVCDPIAPGTAAICNTASRYIECRVTISNAGIEDCGRYYLKADYSDIDDITKCPAVENFTPLCVVPRPIASGDPDKTVCFGKPQTLNFKATFPRSTCTSTTDCPTFCVPSVAMVKKVPAVGGGETEMPLTSGGGLTVTCDPVSTLPNGDREINCRVVVAAANASHCANYCIRATCGNLAGTNKCDPSEWCAKLCVINNPTVSIEPEKYVCGPDASSSPPRLGGDQRFAVTVRFPAQDCFYCPPTACEGVFELVKRDSCTATSGGTVIPINPAAPLPRVYATCAPPTGSPVGTRDRDCTIFINDAVESDCGGYFVRAISCPQLPLDKCMYVEQCGRLCVTPPSKASGDPRKYVCVGGNQTINLSACFPNATCIVCPTNPNTYCPTYVQLYRRLPNGVEENIPYTGGPIGGPALPRITAVCDPATTVTTPCVGRRINCRVTITGAQPGDCAEYGIRSNCGNPADNKCNPDTYRTPLCVFPPPSTGGDPNKYVCVKGVQHIDLYATFPAGDCLPPICDDLGCTRVVSIKRIAPNGTERTLNIGGSITDVVTYPSLPPDPPTGPETVTSTTSVTCQPFDPVTRRINCRVTITNANDLNCGRYCITARCDNFPLTGPDSGKCVASTYCTQLCIMRPPVARVERPEACVCVGGCQRLRFFADFPLPNCTFVNDPATGTTNVPPCDGTSCVPLITFYKIKPDGTRVDLVAGTGVDQYTCDPITQARTINCYVGVGGGTDGPGVGPIGPCPGARLDEDNTVYCMRVTCGGLAEGKCLTDEACTRLRVYERPCPTLEKSIWKICERDELCIPFTYPPNPCCPNPLIELKRIVGGNTVNLPLVLDPAGTNTTAKYRVTGSGTNRTLRIRPAVDADDGNYAICVSCTDAVIAGEKNCSCCTPFCIEVYAPPVVSIMPLDSIGTPGSRTRTVCVGGSATFDFCLGIAQTGPCTPPLITCPPEPDTALLTIPGYVPVRYRIDRIRNASGDFQLPPPGAPCNLGGPTDPWAGVFLLTPGPVADPTSPNYCPTGRLRYQLRIPEVRREMCGFYRMSLEYCGLDNTCGSTDPIGICRTCIYFEIDCEGRVCLRDECECPDFNAFMCPRFVQDPLITCEMAYAMNPRQFRYDYGLESARICGSSAAQCLQFRWYYDGPAAPGAACLPDAGFTHFCEVPADDPNFFFEGVTTVNRCCLNLGTAGPEDVHCYILLVTTDTTSPGCTGREPCRYISPPGCFTLKPPEDCCWCTDCCWDNGMRDDVDPNGVLSMKPAHGEFPEIKAAADFFLCDGQYHHIKQFSASMLIRQNPALPYKAKVTLYEDCDGCPGEVIRMWEIRECTIRDPDDTGLRYVDYKLEFTEADKLWLRGGKTYWWSIQGIGDLITPNYEAYWVLSDLNRIVGSVPKKMEVGVDEGWEPLDECCIECDELAYCIDCDMCKIIYDGGKPELCENAGGTRSEKSASPTRNSRAADNFVTPPAIYKGHDPTVPDYITCTDWMVCYVEAYIYTNCNEQTFTAWLEIYNNECKQPNYVLTNSLKYRYRADKIERVVPECLATIDGVPNLRLYKVRFCPMVTDEYDHGLFLLGGTNYWASISVEDGFSQNQRAYWAWNSDDCDSCPIQFGPGKQIAPGRNINRWTSVDRDFAIVIAAMPPMEMVPPPAPPVATVTCPPDTNRDGSVTVQDMFDFLAAWFAGCP